MVTELTAENFDTFIKSTANPVLVDLWATWCGPCRMLSPLVDQFAAAHADTVSVGKVNVDDESEIAMQFGVQSIPTLLLFKDGKLVNKSVGYIPMPALEAFVATAK